MDLKGLSDGLLTAATLVIEQGRSVPLARAAMRTADEERRARQAERGQGEGGPSVHRQWLNAELEEREAEEERLLLESALAEPPPPPPVPAELNPLVARKQQLEAEERCRTVEAHEERARVRLSLIHI